MTSISVNNSIIQIKNIFKSFKEVKAVQGVSFDIKKGEFVALLGPNGAGKTTLVEIIEGIQTPDSGEVFINNLHWQKHKNELNKIIGLSLQETRFIDKLTVSETLILFASFYKIGKERVNEVLKLINLEEKSKAFVVNLSGGQRQRLALGIALLNNPQVLLLDEPTTGLDPTARHEIWDILLDLKNNFNTSLILTTHYMEEAEFLCDRIVIMDKGKILLQGTLNELLSHTNSDEIIEFEIDKYDFDFNISDENIVKIEKTHKRGNYKIYVKSIISVLPNILNYSEKNSLKLKNLICRKLTLDDLFISLTGRGLQEGN